MQQQFRSQQQFCPHCGGYLDRSNKLLQHSTFDDATKMLNVNGKYIHTTPAQWRVLSALRERIGRIVPNEFLIITAAPNTIDGGSANVLRVHIHNLRKKLAGSKFMIKGHYGGGYELIIAEAAASAKAKEEALGI